jgi:O-antigen/teichoic acid export membrane protein
MKRLMRGGASSMIVNQASKTSIQFIVTIYLSRVLDPSIYGNFALALVYIIIAETIRDFGFSNLAMQKQEYGHSDFSWNFWVLFIRGTALTVVILCFTAFTQNPPIGVEGSTLQNNLLILSFIPIISGLSMAYNVDLWRRNRILTLVLTDLSALVLSLLVIPILLHYQLKGLILPLQLVTYNLLLLLFRAVATRALPNNTLPKNIFRNLYRQPPFLGLMASLKVLASNLDSFLIGTLSGSYALGIYNRAYQMTYVPIQQLLESQTSLVINRSRNVSSTEFIDNLHRKLSPVVVFALAFACVNSKSVVVKLYGDNWIEVAIPFALLACSGIFRSLDYKLYWYQLTSDAHKLLLQLTAVKQIFTILGICLGVFYGLKGVCVGLLVSSIIGYAIEVYALIKKGILKSILNLKFDLVSTLLAFALCGVFALSYNSFFKNSNLGLIISFPLEFLIFWGFQRLVLSKIRL